MGLPTTAISATQPQPSFQLGGCNGKFSYYLTRAYSGKKSAASPPDCGRKTELSFLLQLHLLKLLVKATGKKGLSQGGVLSPVLSNLYLKDVDRMLERAQDAARRGACTYVEYARFADDLVILVDAYAEMTGCTKR
jgi:hypothetical protein